MPAVVGRRSPPPKLCPICRDQIWSFDVTRNILEAWRLYRAHIHTLHPDYESWNRRATLYYLVVLAIFVGATVAVPFVSANLSGLTAGLALALLVVGGGIVFLSKQKGTRRFRELWNREHGGPIK